MKLKHVGLDAKIRLFLTVPKKPNFNDTNIKEFNEDKKTP